jgi:hypothetical protein
MRTAVVVAGLLLMLSEALGAESTYTNLRNHSQRVIIAQSFCAICKDERTYCVLKCNGSGTCIQICDDDYRLCVERACGR